MNEINLIAPISETGYGYASINIIKALNKKIKVNLYPVSSEGDLHKEEFIKSSLNNKNFKSKDNPCLLIFGQGDLYRFVGKNQHIGMCFFELDRFTDSEKDSLLHCDKIFVPSTWAKNIIIKELKQFKNNIGDYVFVVPLGVDREIFYENDKEKFIHSSTIFYNCGKWERRKGQDFLKTCFEEAFEKNDNVELWMQCHNFFIGHDNNKTWENFFLSGKLGSKVKIIPRLKTHKDVANIMNKIDCGIFPARAEGWNLELLEVMACGKHVITSNYSAHTEFCNYDNSLLFDVEELEQAYDGLWNNGQGFWAKFGNKQKDQVIKHMRDIHDKKQNNMLDVNKNGIQTSKDFSWDATAEKIIKILFNQT